MGGAISAGTVQIDATSTITADSQGYVGSGCSGPGAGPGGGLTNCNNAGNGGSYGGLGGGPNQASETTYGSASAPTDLGSGGSGGYVSPVGGAGGGAIRLIVSGTLTNNGAITANGGYGNNCSGGGAGGSIYVTTGTLAGAGVFKANGGAAPNCSNGGGGGRVAVYYTSAGSFTGFTTSRQQGAITPIMEQRSLPTPRRPTKSFTSTRTMCSRRTLPPHSTRSPSPTAAI